jgi:predicted RNase H-like HicB family nuclease
METSLNIADLAQKIRSIDTNIYTLEELRSRIMQLIDEYLQNIEQKGQID